MSFGRKPKVLLNDEPSLYEYAIGALGRRMRTVAELKRLMRPKVEDSEYGRVLVETVIARLKEEKYLNDSQYAATFSSLRKENERFGKRRVISDLKQRGVHDEVISKAVSATYEDTNEEQLARDFLRRKRLKKPSNEKETARIFRAMVRAGFGSRTIFAILKNWDVDDEVLSALEEEEPPTEQ
ncbi:MAG TPA: regulatory protein RecX [Terriglobales bacterium]|nr:regulatory protein RecX [Terriglobales bacterium]